MPQSKPCQCRYCRYTRTARMRKTTTLATMRFLSMKGEKPRAAVLATRSGNGTPKVNECAWRVKRKRGTVQPLTTKNTSVDKEARDNLLLLARLWGRGLRLSWRDGLVRLGC